jgi:hypothetical protein
MGYEGGGYLAGGWLEFAAKGLRPMGGQGRCDWVLTIAPDLSLWPDVRQHYAVKQFNQGAPSGGDRCPEPPIGETDD